MEFKDIPGQAIRHKQAVEATLIHACSVCGAPGVFKSHESIRVGWPGCWVPPGHPQDNRPVGDTCPNCDAMARKSSRRESGIIGWGAAILYASMAMIWRRSPSLALARLARKGILSLPLACRVQRPAQQDLGVIWHNGG
jgi:hypothetical protein